VPPAADVATLLAVAAARLGQRARAWRLIQLLLRLRRELSPTIACLIAVGESALVASLADAGGEEEDEWRNVGGVGEGELGKEGVGEGGLGKDTWRQVAREVWVQRLGAAGAVMAAALQEFRILQGKGKRKRGTGGRRKRGRGLATVVVIVI